MHIGGEDPTNSRTGGRHFQSGCMPYSNENHPVKPTPSEWMVVTKNAGWMKMAQTKRLQWTSPPNSQWVHRSSRNTVREICVSEHSVPRTKSWNELHSCNMQSVQELHPENFRLTCPVFRVAVTARKSAREFSIDIIFNGEASCHLSGSVNRRRFGTGPTHPVPTGQRMFTEKKTSQKLRCGVAF